MSVYEVGLLGSASALSFDALSIDVAGARLGAIHAELRAHCAAPPQFAAELISPTRFAGDFARPLATSSVVKLSGMANKNRSAKKRANKRSVKKNAPVENGAAVCDEARRAADAVRGVAAPRA